MRRYLLLLAALALPFLVGASGLPNAPTFTSPGANVIGPYYFTASSPAAGIYVVGYAFPAATLDFEFGSSFDGTLYACDSRDPDSNDDGTISDEAACDSLAALDTADVQVNPMKTGKLWYVLEIDTAGVATLTIKGTWQSLSGGGGGSSVFTDGGSVAYPTGGETLQDDASASDWSISPDGVGFFGGGVNLGGSLPTFRFYDAEADPTDVMAYVLTECSDVNLNQEDCDVFFLQKRAGSMINRVRMDADDGLDLFAQTGTYVTLGDGGTTSYARFDELGVLSFQGSGGLTAQTRTDCSTITGEGRICWDSDDDALYLGDGSIAQVQAGGGSGDVTAVGSGTNGIACESGACFDGANTGNNLSVIDDLMIWLDDDQGTTPNSSRFEIYNGAGTLVFYVDEDGVTYSAPTAAPSIGFSDSDKLGTPDTNVQIVADCPTGTTAGGDEDCDLSFQTQVDGLMTEAFKIDTTDGGVQSVIFTADVDLAADSITVDELSVTGTPDGTKFLRDDGAWVNPPGSGVSEIAAGTATVNPGSIASEACDTSQTTTATGAATTDVVSWSFAQAMGGTGTTVGYSPETTGGVSVNGYVSASNTITWEVCNWSTGSIDPASVSINWRIDQ